MALPAGSPGANAGPDEVPGLTEEQADELGIDTDKVLEIRNKLDTMIGLGPVKAQVDNLIAVAAISREREAEGKKPISNSMHLLFAGPPGTGKTETARLIAPLYHALGLIPKNSFIEPRLDELQGEVLGETPAKVQEVLNKGRGGVIFIDEAYNLVNGKDDMYGYQAVTAIMQFAEDHRDDTVVILGGYPNKLKELLGRNEGMESRFSRAVQFQKYKHNDLANIGLKMIGDKQYQLDAGAKASFKQAIKEHGDGNARHARDLVDSIVEAHAMRTYGLDEGDEGRDLGLLTDEDVKNGSAARHGQKLVPA